MGGYPQFLNWASTGFINRAVRDTGHVGVVICDAFHMVKPTGLSCTLNRHW